VIDNIRSQSQRRRLQGRARGALLGSVHKRRPLVGGEGVVECVTDFDSRGRGCLGYWEVHI